MEEEMMLLRFYLGNIQVGVPLRVRDVEDVCLVN